MHSDWIQTEWRFIPRLQIIFGHEQIYLHFMKKTPINAKNMKKKKQIQSMHKLSWPINIINIFSVECSMSAQWNAIMYWQRCFQNTNKKWIYNRDLPPRGIKTRSAYNTRNDLYRAHWFDAADTYLKFSAQRRRNRTYLWLSVTIDSRAQGTG